MLHRFFWLALLGAWTGLVLGTWAWAGPLPLPEAQAGAVRGVDAAFGYDFTPGTIPLDGRPATFARDACDPC